MLFSCRTTLELNLAKYEPHRTLWVHQVCRSRVAFSLLHQDMLNLSYGYVIPACFTALQSITPLSKNLIEYVNDTDDELPFLVRMAPMSSLQRTTDVLNNRELRMHNSRPFILFWTAMVGAEHHQPNDNTNQGE